MRPEIWKDINGYGGLYQISSLGRIRTYARNFKGRIIGCGTLSSKGYPRVNLESGTYYAVHRLVAEHFIPNPEGKPQVNHKDGNKTNNTACNLEWVTNQENRDHACAYGLTVKGTDVGTAKLDDAKVILIRKLYAAGTAQKSLGRLFGVGQQTISAIVTLKTWKHLTA